MPLVLVGWRSVLLLLMAIAPWGAPLEATLSTDLRVQIGLGFAALVGMLAVIARRFESRSSRDKVGWLLALAVLVSLAGALTFPIYARPLSVLSIVVAIPLWAAIVLWVRERVSTSAVLRMVPIVLCCGSWMIGGGRVLSAEPVWRSIVVQNPRWIVAHHSLLQLLEQRSAPVAERDHVALRCTELVPSDARCRLLSVRSALARRDWERVVELTRVGLTNQSTDPVLLAAQSTALHELQRSDTQSITALRSAVAANETNAALRLNLATALQSAGRFREALEIFQTASVAQDLPTQQLLAAVAIQAEDWTAARQAVDRILAVEPENVTGRLNLGLIEQHEGHFNRAREAYLRALRADSHNFAARYNLARLVFDVGATDEALHHAQRLLELNARDQRVRLLVREIQDRVFAIATDAGTR